MEMEKLQEAMSKISSEYEAKTPKSRELYAEMRKTFPGGVLHNISFFQPYPFIVTGAKNQHLYDVDGNEYVDYWMGHMALILGHTPRPVVEALEGQAGNGTHFGTVNTLAAELGRLVCRLVPCAEMVRFCCSGTESTMYASRLVRAYTGRRLILKAEGGWHGGNLPLHKAVTSPFDVPESRGILPEEMANTLTFIFNDVEGARRVIRENGEDLAGVIVEPVQGGAIPAEADFLRSLREETERYGALLVFDEVITGFRLGLGGGQGYFGVKPDLCTLGKVLGGGMPIGAVCGRREIMGLADPTVPAAKSERVWIGGGTFSGNPMTMAAGIAALRTLSGKGDEVYGKINGLVDKAREGIDSIFTEHGIPAHTAGLASLLLTFFLKEDGLPLRSKTDVANNADGRMQHAYYLSLMTRYGAYFLPGQTGAVSYAHTDGDIDRMLEATEDFARLVEKG